LARSRASVRTETAPEVGYRTMNEREAIKILMEF
jgi:hypothetical protein